MSATALDRPVPGAEAPSADDAADTTVSVLQDLAAAEPLWRRLEAEALLTPYQRYDWIRQLVAARDERPTLAIAAIEQNNSPVALLPLEIGRRMGARCATFIGSDIGNADWMIVAPAAARRLGASRIRDALAAVSEAVGGIDLVMLRSQPTAWQGVANPLLAFPHQPGPDHLHLGTLNPKGSFARFDEKRLAHFLRRKRKLAAAHGEVTLRRAQTPEEVDRFHAAFLEQRAARFAQMGIPNIFAEPHFLRLFREGAIASFGDPRPALVFHALFAGERIIATAVGSFCGTHYTQYINATAGGEVAKFRLIGILMHELLADAAATGATTIDMGLGDFDYKTDWTAPEIVYDGMVAMTLRGRLAGASLLAARRLKRAIKQHDRLWALARKLRGALAGRRPRPSQEH